MGFAVSAKSMDEIVGQTSMPMKLYLKDAKLSLGGDNKLTIVVEDGLASDYFLKQEGHKEILVPARPFLPKNQRHP